MTGNSHHVIVALLGARMHYAVPAILARAGMLERLFTDLSAVSGWPRLLGAVPSAVCPGSIQRIRARIPDGVPASRIRAFNAFGIEYARRRARARTPAEMTHTFLWANREFGARVCASNWGDASAVFTFNCAGLEILRRARREGLSTVVEQTIAPSVVEHRLLQEERALHAGWEAGVEDHAAADYSAREQAEWPLADLILCGSEFVRDGVRTSGGPVEKCVIVPYGVDVPSLRRGEGGRQDDVATINLQPSTLNRPLRVLTVGAVGLRKGAPYVLEAARQLDGRAIFRWVGAVNLLPEAAAQMREYIELTGPVPRTEIAAHYHWADVFLLPSVCEGSATVTYEALGWGLPVICTPNTGSVVRDRVEGCIVPVRDGQAIAECLEGLALDRDQLSRMAANALRGAQDFTLPGYGKRLLAALAPGLA